VNRFSRDIPISLLYSLLGALSGVFICALIGVNFSKGVNISEVQDFSTQAKSQPNLGLSDGTLLNFSQQATLQRLQSQLSFCQMDLQRAKMDALQNQLNNRR
jgi:hypothetical protein